MKVFSLHRIVQYEIEDNTNFDNIIYCVHLLHGHCLFNFKYLVRDLGKGRQLC